MPQISLPIESAYCERVDAMSPAERVARSTALFQWTREQLARQIVAEQHGDGVLEGIAPESLQWLVALQLYANEPIIRCLIERRLRDVSG